MGDTQAAWLGGETYPAQTSLLGLSGLRNPLGNYPGSNKPDPATSSLFSLQAVPLGAFQQGDTHYLVLGFIDHACHPYTVDVHTYFAGDSWGNFLTTLPNNNQGALGEQARRVSIQDFEREVATLAAHQDPVFVSCLMSAAQIKTSLQQTFLNFGLSQLSTARTLNDFSWQATYETPAQDAIAHYGSLAPYVQTSPRQAAGTLDPSASVWVSNPVYALK